MEEPMTKSTVFKIALLWSCGFYLVLGSACPASETQPDKNQSGNPDQGASTADAALVDSSQDTTNADAAMVLDASPDGSSADVTVVDSASNDSSLLEDATTGCSDDTEEAACSPTQPYRCESGVLVERAAICGCPGDRQAEGDRCIFPADTTVLEIINSLGNNEGAWLPEFSVAGNNLDAWPAFATRGPGIRDYCRKWVYSTTRSRAYYAGANHGAPHRFNDIWDYDLASNTWTLLFGPDFNGNIYNQEQLMQTIDQNCSVIDNVFQSNNGGICNAGHTWWQFTYDDTADAVFWMSQWVTDSHYWTSRGIEDTIVNDELPPFWAYYPATGTWQLMQTATAPRDTNGAALEYVPGRGTVWYGAEWNSDGMWVYDSQQNTWAQWLDLNDTYFSDQAPRTEALVNYDATNDIMVAFREASIFHYSFTDNIWEVHGTTGTIADAHDARAASAYDQQNGVHLLRTGDTLYIYDAATSTVTQTNPLGGMPDSAGMTYYDKTYNIFVFYLNETRHWVYRYKIR